MTREEFRAKWNGRRSEWEKLGVVLNGGRICEEFIADFEDVLKSHDEAVLNTNQAAAMTGYSRARLLGLYRQGRLRGHRNGNNVFFRAADLPKKPRGERPMPADGPGVKSSEVSVTTRQLAEKLRLRPLPVDR